MSRNRIRGWDKVSFTIPADAGQVPADPACKKMWDTPDGKVPGGKKPHDSEWTEFRKKHGDKISPDLVRLSWRQCAACLLYTSPSPRDATLSGMPSSA